MNVLINYSNSVKVLFDINKDKMPADIKDYFENVFKIINSEYVGGILSDETITLIDEFEDYVFKYNGLGDICLTQLLSHLQLNAKRHKYVEHKTTRGTVQMCKHCSYIKEDNGYRKKLNLNLDRK